MQMRGTTLPAVLGLGVAVAASLALAAPGVAAPGDPAATRAPLHWTGKPSEIPGRYIVVMDQKSSRSDRAVAQRTAHAQGGAVTLEYGAALNGFAAELPERAVEALRHNPHVRYIEADTEVTTAATQSGAPWNLDRIDQRNLPLNGTYRYDRTGAGVTAYIIDTGIRKTHKQFGSRVLAGYTAVNDGRGTNDCNGHGTHVAGTVGATKYGVAKGVTLRPVRVLNCNGVGSTAKLIAGVDYVTRNHAAGKPAVANMSLGGDSALSLDLAVRNSIADGVTYVAAAGNESRDACGSSPGRVDEVITVGATTKTDARANYSNYGSCVDLFAPGSGITSAWKTSNTATKTISGTSMASPHVAGAAALVLQQNPAASPYAVGESLLQATTPGLVTGPAGSPNRLLYSLAAAVEPPAITDSVVNGGFEQGAVAWEASPDVITNDPNAPAYQGSWKAWLAGYGSAGTDTLSQTFVVPAGGATLSFRLLIGTEEGLSTAYDWLYVDVSGAASRRLATYSNRNAGDDYVKRSFDLSDFSGQTVTLELTGTENSSAATSFLVDNVSLTPN